MSKWLDYILFASNGESGQYYRAEGKGCAARILVLSSKHF